MRKALLLLLPVLLLVLGAVGGWYWWTDWRFLQSTDDAYVQSDVSLISPKVEGYIKEVQIRDNEAVAAGQVLFVIDDRDFAAKLAQAEAALAIEEATVATYVSRLNLQRTMIDQAAATLRPAEADPYRPHLDHKRYAALVTSDFASRQRYETAEADSRKAEAALGKGRAALAAAANQLAVIEAQQREAEARVLQARATRQLAKNDLDNTVIRTPIAGVAGNRAG